MTPLRRAKPLLWRARLPRLLVVTARHRGISPADAFLVSYPKSGNTWLKALLTYLVTGREFDFDEGDSIIAPVGRHAAAPALLPGGGRIIKSHERFHPWYGRAYGRVVYLVRDGRDVCVSYHHALIRREDDRRPFPRFVDDFIRGNVEGYGSWQGHVTSWLESPQNTSGRLHLVRYEDLVAAPAHHLARIAAFIGLEAAPERIAEAVRLHTPSRMRERESASATHAAQPRPDLYIVRRGGTGEWRERFSTADADRFTAAARAVLARLGYPESTRDAERITDAVPG